MTAISTKNLQIMLEKKGAASRTEISVTAVSKALDAELTATATGVNAGDVVLVGNTGFSEIDGNAYYVKAATGTTITLAGANTVGSNGTVSGTAKVQVIKRADMVRLCLSQFDIGNASTATTDVSTFCGDASLPGAVTPGTLTLGGYPSPDDEGFEEIVKADGDAQARAILLILPASPELTNGAFVGEVSLSGLGYTLPLNGAVGFTITATQARKFAYRFPLTTH